MRIMLFVILSCFISCDDVEIKLHPCEIYGLYNSWCDEEGKTNICVVDDETGLTSWQAYQCNHNDSGWFCDESIGLCACTPGDTWCLPHNGKEFNMECQENGDFAIGFSCYNGCNDNMSPAICL